MIANRLGRPVKWTESRSENMVATHHGRDQIQFIEMAATREGKILGMKVELLANMGAYLQLLTPGIPVLGQFMFNGIYKMDAYDWKSTGVFTTTTPTDAYRGAGRPEATFAVERMLDELAVELDIEPMELRRRNWIQHEEFPYTTVAGLTYDSGNYEAATARAMELFDYDGLRAEQAARRASGDPVQLGIGISTFTEMCGLAPSRTLVGVEVRGRRLGALHDPDPADRQGRTGHRYVPARAGPRHRLEPDRQRLTGHPGGRHRGDLRRHRARAVRHGHLRVPVAGRRRGGDPARRRGRRRQGQGDRRVTCSRSSPDDLEFVDGSFRVKGDPDSAKTIQAVAWEAFTSHDLPDGTDPNLFGASTVDPQVFSYPHGTHLCAVEVDTETGMTKIRTYVAVDDVGVQINPMIVEGQIHGGITQGIAQALWEGAFYDEDGNLITASLADYLLPTAAGRAVLRHRPDRHPVHHPPAGHQGRGGGRRHRLHPGGDQRHHRRAAASRGDGRADAGHPADRLAGDPGGLGESGRCRIGYRRRVMIPSSFDYVRPSTVDEAVAALTEGGDDAKVITGGQSLLPLLRIRLAAPHGAGRLRPDRRRCAGCPTPATLCVIGAATTHHDVLARPAGASSTRRCWR